MRKTADSTHKFHKVKKPVFLMVAISGIVAISGSSFVYGQSAGGGADGIEEVVVTGFRKSLDDALESKRDSVLTTESILAEDIGKFPDLNLAEALQRTSGIAITRDNGEGQQISLRGLGPSYSRVLWNGVPVSTASDGGTDISAANRQFDFDVFSSELFGRIDVSKSAAAHQVEGGIAGVINLRNVSPFDFKGFNVSLTYKQGFQDLADDNDSNYSFIVSNTFADDTFGALFGFTSSDRSVRVDGYESQDWVSAAARGFTYTTPNDSGLSDEDLGNLLLPRLPRTEIQFGSRERISYVAAFQWNPNDDFDLNLDILGARLESDIERYNFDAEIRNREFTATDAVVGASNTVQSIHLAGVNRRSENRTFVQETSQLHVALSGVWHVSDNFKLDGVLSIANSEYDNRHTTFLARLLDTEIDIVIPGGSRPIPEVTTDVSITDPSNFFLDLIRVSPDYREEETTAFHIDATWGDDESNLRFGLAFDNFMRDQKQWDYRGSPDADIFAPSLVSPSVVPTVDQLASTLPFSDYLSILGATTDVTTDHLIIRPSAMAAYYDLGALDANAPVREAGTNDTEESTLGGYVELNHSTDFMGRTLRVNIGTRIINTKLDVAAPFQGALVKQKSSYTEFLPSFNLSLNIRDDLIVRLGGARTMTRPDIGALVPNSNVSSNGDVTSGNSELVPFLADQLDFGLEWYFADGAVLAGSIYAKNITGFIQNASTTGPFGASGISISVLDPQIFSFLTLDTPVNFNQPQNNPDATEINGLELLYQQPLDFITPGFGLLFNYSQIQGDTSFMTGNGEIVPSNIVGLSENSYNIVVYYERDNYAVRGSWNYRDDYTVTSCCRNDQPLLAIREGTGQFDMSATYILPFADNVTLTLEGINLNESEEYTYFGASDKVRRYIGSGRQVFLGVRAVF